MDALRAWMGSDLDHGWHMDALRAWMGSDLHAIMVGTWMLSGSDLDVIMVGTWMLCGHGWGLIWTLSWLAHGWMLVGRGCCAPGWGRSAA